MGRVALQIDGQVRRSPRVSEALYELTMSVAESRLDKAAVAVELERIAKTKR